MVMDFKTALGSRRWICFLLLIATVAALLLNFTPLQSLEYRAFDLLSRFRKSAPGIPVIIVAIDDASLKKMGDWPWPRAYIAEVINTLTTNATHTLGVSILYRDEERKDGLVEIQNIQETIRKKPLIGEKRTLSKIDQLLSESYRQLSYDNRLMAAVRTAHNVVLPLRFNLSQPNDEAPTALSDWLKLNSIESDQKQAEQKQPYYSAAFLSGHHFNQPLVASDLGSPYAKLSRKSGALGHTNLVADPDHITRSVPLLIRFQNREFLSFALQVAMKYFGANTRNVRPDSSGLRIKHLYVPTVGYYQMLIDFSGQERNIEKFAASDVLEGKIPATAFHNKIVLLGITAEAFTPLYRIPGNVQASGIEIMANAVENLVNRRHISRPVWSLALEVMILLYFGFFLLFVIPKVQPRIGMLIFAIFLLTWIGTAAGLLLTQGLWLRMITPTLFALIGFALIGHKRFFEETKDESVELNKSLGLSLQGQGMLDMAFERFMKCPIQDKSVKALLYHLGLDFERKRMFNKALAVYNQILKAGTFKDIKHRIKNLEKIEQTLVMSPGQKKRETSLFLGDSTTRPTLGRYEILKELGHGAMGTVYLGKDPSINREVAIKTLNYADVEAQQLTEVKDQFFREAEAAGRLSHPNIVTIYDVGEDHDMAYIAMELLKGKNLSEFCQKDTLLPIGRILSVITSVAEALDYAHNQGVVHRDIKPANIILMENDRVKVADFGIARVMTSSTKTQTGVIFGTPNYMSPEQVAAQKVDGRSDLFSLGIVLYEMLSAEKPFKGDSITTLMYAITNNTYKPLPEVAPKTPQCCVKIVKKLLRKEAAKRYQSAVQVVKQIKKCQAQIANH
jgi:CHASE2 domain-containing sensor protein/predicted Ser/Thr protein kinase